MPPLVVHSRYSLMWGTASPRQVCRAARQLGYERLALTDTDNLYGLWPFLAACRREGITPIVGAEVTEPGRSRRAVCLVETDKGYRNLCRLQTRRHLEAATFDLENDLIARADGLTVLTLDPGLLAAWHDAGVRVAAAMPRRPLVAGHPLLVTARRRGVPVVAVPGSYFIRRDDLAVHRLLRAIDRNTCLAHLAPETIAPADGWLAAPDEYRRRFATCLETLDAAAAIAERLTFTGPHFGAVLLPLPGPDGPAAADRLRADAYAGAHRRYDDELSEAVVEFPPPWPEILAHAQRIIGTPRYLSVHPGGVVITPRPIDEYVPVERAPKGVPIIQWEKDAAEDAGLVKIDLLGNRSLGVIRDALANLQVNGAAVDETRWEPEADFATQASVAQGRTMGCFYIESPAMRLLQQKSRVGDFEHLVIHSSIIRPAANDYIREYIRRLHGGPWDPIHPLLTDVLAETFGIMVYQEDVSRVAVALAGFSHAEADGLRKILSKKDRELQLRDFARRFREGARAQGGSEAQVTAIWDMMMSFDGYSFCKPHSASYARVSFQAAFLKVHHPAEFMAAVISNQGGFYSAFAYVSEARRLGLEVLPPDVNASDVCWAGEKAALRVGLLSIKDLAAGTQERIVAGRTDRTYAGLGDFLERVRPDATELRALVHCGALDCLVPGASRAELLWESARRLPSRSPAGRAARNRSLFETPGADERSPHLPPDDACERLRREFAVLGFLCDRHPIELFADAVHRAGTVKAADVPRRVGRWVRFAGWLITGKVVETKKGEPMEFLTFEDETGLVETTFFPEAYRRFCHLLDRERPYLLSGKVEEDWGAVTLTVEKTSVLIST